MIKKLEVIAQMTEYGKVIPLTIIWEDGRQFNIDKVIEEKPLASTKGGGVGIRYKCKIKNQTKYLFLNDYNWWIEIED